MERLRQAVAVLGTVPDMNDAEVQCKMRGGAINGPFKMGEVRGCGIPFLESR